MPTAVSTSFLALPSPEVHHHGTDGNDKAGKLRTVELVAVEVDTGHEGRYLPCQTNDRTGEGTELGNGHKDKDLAHGTGQAEGYQQEPHVLTHLDEEMDLVEHEQTDAGQDRFAQLNVVHQVERTHGMDAHQLILVRTGATIEAQRDEEEEDAKGLGGGRQTIVVVVAATLLALAAAAPHEEADSGHDEADIDVLPEGIFLPHEGPHDHDGDRLAALGQDLDGVDDVAQAPHREKGGAHGREAKDGEAGRGDGRGSFLPNVPAAGGREGVEAGGDEEEGQLVELPAAAGGVLQEEAVDDERSHDAEEADEEPDEVGGLGLGRAAPGLAGVGGGVRIFRRRPVQVVGSHSPLAAVPAEFANVLSAATAAAHNCLVVVIVVEGVAAAVVLVVAIRRPSFAAGSGAALGPVRERLGPGRPAAGHHDRRCRCRCHMLGGRPRLGIVRAAAAVRRAPGAAAAAAALGGRRRGLPGKVVVLCAVGGRRGRRRCRRVISGRARARRLLALAGAVAALVPSPSIPASGGLLLAAGGGSSGREDPWLLRAHLVLRSIVRSTAREHVLITAASMVAWTVESAMMTAGVESVSRMNRIENSDAKVKGENNDARKE